MPVGAPEALPFVLRAMRRGVERHSDVFSVLDLGIGYGFWGAAIRNYFSTGPDGRLRRGRFRLTGVEAFPAYENPMWAFYDEVVVAPIEDHLDLVGRANLVVAIDVLEHLPMEIGKRILRESRAFVAGVPREHEQGEHYGNPRERHLSMWTEKDMWESALLTTFLRDVNPEANPGIDYIVGEKW